MTAVACLAKQGLRLLGGPLGRRAAACLVVVGGGELLDAPLLTRRMDCSLSATSFSSGEGKGRGTRRCAMEISATDSFTVLCVERMMACRSRAQRPPVCDPP